MAVVVASVPLLTAIPVSGRRAVQTPQIPLAGMQAEMTALELEPEMVMAVAAEEPASTVERKGKLNRHANNDFI